MSAPDKIFVRRYPDINMPDNIGVSWWREKSSDTDIEYIRKGALVKWAKNNLCASAYVQLVNKLKTL